MLNIRLENKNINTRSNIVSRYYRDVNSIKKTDKDIFDQTKEDLIKDNLKFAISVANHFCKSQYEIPDLIQAANIGLIKAAEKFDPKRGFKFISYAVNYIYREIMTFQNVDSDWYHRNKGYKKKYYKFLNFINELRNEYECDIKNDEALFLYKNNDETLSNGLNFDNIVSINEQIYSDNDKITYEDTLQSADSNLDKDYVNDLKYKFGKLIQKMPKIYRETIIDYYYNNHSISFIASKYNITESAVRSRLNRGIKLLKQKKSLLYDY